MERIGPTKRENSRRPPAPWSTGRVLGERYRVVRLAGVGGVGEVYEAVDLASGTRVAVKTVARALLGSAKALARFRREGKLARRIRHANVLRVLDFLELPSEDGWPTLILVTEFLDGESLADRLERSGPLSVDEARGLVAQMASALSAAHAVGVVHRDLKPDNVFLVPRPRGVDRVVLTDFGASRSLALVGSDSLTAPEVIMGTPTYMSPEQVELGAAVPESDVYALGLVVYEMLTGKLPFEARLPIQAVSMRLNVEPVSPKRHLPELSDEWESLILGCLRRDPGQRPDSESIARAMRAKPESAKPGEGPAPWV